jgi:6-phosphogluconolactonase
VISLALLGGTPLHAQFAYVVDANDRSVSGYTIDSSTGALKTITGSPFAAGSRPFFVAVDPSGKFVYVANKNGNNVSGYTIDSSTGVLKAITGSPFAAESEPVSIAFAHPSPP